MMTLLQNGEPVIVNHTCSNSSRIGKKMTNEELHNFSVEIFARWEKACSVTVNVVNKKGNSSTLLPDLIITREIYPQNVAYIVVNKGGENISDLSFMVRLWQEKEYLPKLITADLYCFDTNGGDVLCGGSFAAKFTSQSLLPNEINYDVEPKSNEQVVRLLKQAWEQLDVSIIEPYFDKDLHYKSDWVFEDMCSRWEYVHYLRCKFDALRNGSNPFRIRIGVNSNDGSLALLLNESAYNGQLVMFIGFHNGRINNLWLRELNEIL